MTKELDLVAQVEIDIPFHDVDAAEIVWHGHYVKYIEIARCKLLDKLDYNYSQMEDSGYFWPVIDLRLRYAHPARFQQTVRVVASLAEWEHRLKINYQITDAESGKRLTKGYSVQVAVDSKTGEMLLASPAVLYRKLGVC
jgi:acyl-CoA thioester hydrolase